MNTLASGKFPKTFSAPKTKKPKKFPKFLVILGLIILIGAGLYYWVYYSTFFQIKNIVITGGSLENLDQNSLKGQNILLINLNSLKTKIRESHPEIGEVKIIRGLPDTLKIESQPNQASLVWQTGSNQYLVDNEGIIFGLLQGQTDLPLISDQKNVNVQVGKKVVTVNFIDFVKTLLGKFPDATGFKIVNFEINDTVFQVNALTDQGWFIKFDTTRSADDQLEALKKVLAEHKDEIHEYADVRVEGKVYFK